MMPDKKLVFSYLVSILIVTLIIFSVDLESVFEKILLFGFFETITAFVLVFFTFVIRGVIWKYLLLPFKKISFKDSYHITVIGFFLNNFLPLRAGEFARVFLLNRKHELKKIKIFSTIIVERIIQGITLVLFFIVSVFFIPNASVELLNIAFLSTALFFGLFALFIFPNQRKMFLQKIFGFSNTLRKKAFNFSEEIFTGERALNNGLKNSAVIWGSCIVLWSVHFVLYYFVAMVLGIHMGFFSMVILLAVTSLSTVIPSAPGYIGTFEGSFVLVFAAFGLSADQAISFAIVVHLMLFAGTTVLGIFSMNSLRVSFNDFKKIDTDPEKKAHS